MGRDIVGMPEQCLGAAPPPCLQHRRDGEGDHRQNEEVSKALEAVLQMVMQMPGISYRLDRAKSQIYVFSDISLAYFPLSV